MTDAKQKAAYIVESQTIGNPTPSPNAATAPVIVSSGTTGSKPVEYSRSAVTAITERYVIADKK